MSGGGGSTPTQTTSTITQQQLSPEQRRLIEPAVPTVEEFVANPPTPYEGPKIIPFNPLEQQAQERAVGAATGAVQNVADTAAGGQQFLGSGAVLDPRINPGLQGAVNAATRPIFEGLTERALPSIRLGAAMRGQPGSTRRGIAEGIATRGALTAAGDTAANVVNPAYQSGLDAMTRAIALAPQTAGLQFTPAGALGDVGQQQRAMEQVQLNQDIQDFVNEQMLPFLAAREAILLGTGVPGGQVASESVGPSPFVQPSPFQQGLGGLLTGAGAGSVFGPIGAGIGGGLGALAAFL